MFVLKRKNASIQGCCLRKFFGSPSRISRSPKKISNFVNPLVTAGKQQKKHIFHQFLFLDWFLANISLACVSSETQSAMRFHLGDSAKGYGFIAVLVWNRVSISTILAWNSVSIWAILAWNRVWFVHSSLELGTFFRRSYFCLRSRHLEVVGPRKTGEGRGNACPEGPWKSFQLALCECGYFQLVERLPKEKVTALGKKTVSQ